VPPTAQAQSKMRVILFSSSGLPDVTMVSN